MEGFGYTLLLAGGFLVGFSGVNLMYGYDSTLDDMVAFWAGVALWATGYIILL